jgi:hypothetical protein
MMETFAISEAGDKNDFVETLEAKRVRIVKKKARQVRKEAKEKAAEKKGK